ncbi:response regulator [Emergencia sp.]|uniref:PAS domain-containing hybrid sensor histidine kinase/response regulator n=1 Tax=Emergencia sp. TaxID=1926557 RepID=UPI003AEF1CBA
MGNQMIDTIGISAARWILDEKVTFLDANAAYYESTGYSEKEYKILFPNLHQYYENHIEEYHKIREAIVAARKDDCKTFSVDCAIPVQNGTCLWVRRKGIITEEDVNGALIFVTVDTDISDLIEETQGALQRFEWMMDEYGGNVYISDMDNYELLYLNKTSENTLKEKKENLLGRKCYEVIQGRTSPCPFCTNHLLKTDEVYEWEFENPALDCTFMIRNKQIDWYGHRARIELSHDMYSANYKLAKKDRERSEILRAIPGGFARVDARDMRTALWYGGGFLDMIGYTKEQFEEELDSKCNYVHPDDIDHAVEIMESARQTGENTAVEGRIITRDGRVKILTMTYSYVSGEDSWDGIPSFYSMGIDVTRDREEKERQRQALEDAYLAAKLANTAKTDFLSCMSHDIRTPMNAIMGMSAIAQMNLSSPEKVRDCLEKINVSGRHLLALINEVLDMSKIESGQMNLVLGEVSLPDLVQNVADLCNPLIAEKGLDFRISVNNVKHEKIITDGDRLQQVFVNLLSNAIKYTPQGGLISLRINELASTINGKGQYEFIFTDNGIGMKEDFIEHIFEPFSRAEDPRISKIQGTGLGMTITENIVRIMNGAIHVKSRFGEGSQFIVAIQFDLAEDEEICTRDMSGLPVLVVDDDQAVCESTAVLLDELGMRGYWVMSGREAIASIKEAHQRADDYFAVILDWIMPEMNGLETVKVLREEMGEDVPIIIISAYDYSDIEEEFIAAGADAFITKPLFKSKVFRVLQLFCSDNHLETESAASEETLSALDGRHVLLVEDNELNRDIAVELLQMQGLIVDIAQNGKEALEIFQKSRIGFYDAVLMDIQMPVMNGYESTQAIRQLERKDSQTVPILALTADAFTSDVGKAHKAGMNDHISKPIDFTGLVETLEKWIH